MVFPFKLFVISAPFTKLQSQTLFFVVFNAKQTRLNNLSQLFVTINQGKCHNGDTALSVTIGYDSTDHHGFQNVTLYDRHDSTFRFSSFYVFTEHEVDKKKTSVR